MPITVSSYAGVWSVIRTEGNTSSTIATSTSEEEARNIARFVDLPDAALTANYVRQKAAPDRDPDRLAAIDLIATEMHRRGLLAG